MFNFRDSLRKPSAPTLLGMGGTPMPASYGIDWSSLMNPMGNPTAQAWQQQNPSVMKMSDWDKLSHDQVYGAQYGSD